MIDTTDSLKQIQKDLRHCKATLSTTRSPDKALAISLMVLATECQEITELMLAQHQQNSHPGNNKKQRTERAILIQQRTEVAHRVLKVIGTKHCSTGPISVVASPGECERIKEGYASIVSILDEIDRAQMSINIDEY